MPVNMTMVGFYFVHFLSLGLYLLAIGCCVMNIKKTETLPSIFRKSVRWYIAFSIISIMTFIILQGDRMLFDDHYQLGASVSLWWVVYEYLNAMSFIIGMVSLNVGLSVYEGIRKTISSKATCEKLKNLIAEGGMGYS